MSDYDNELRGIVKANKQKVTDDHPDITGSAQIDGVEYWISGWRNIGGPQSRIPGQTYYSLKFRPKDVEARGRRGVQRGRNFPPAPLDDGDQIPF